MQPTENSTATDTRLRNDRLDFLRGVAVILVLVFHHRLIRIGGFGVDLFFVLSGFLVSGLLFSEYKIFGDIKPLHFLTRRGFKIYPLYYLSIAFTTVYVLVSPRFSFLNYKGVLVLLAPEVLFYQNYKPAFWAHHWSLAVEEHFYILLSVLIFFLARRGVLESRKIFLAIGVLVFGLCLALRINRSLHYPGWPTFFQTHLRLDSLFAGVLLGHFYHFARPALANFYGRHKKLLAGLFLANLWLALMRFIPYHPSRTNLFPPFTYTFWYISFGALLIIFLFSEKVVTYLKRILTPRGYRLICKTGFYSYSIYLFHLYLMKFVVGEQYFAGDTRLPPTLPVVLSFVVYFAGSILLGVLASRLVEIPLLRVRDRYFPRRSKPPVAREPVAARPAP